MHSEWVHGNLVYWDTHRSRWIDAIGPDVRKAVFNFDWLPFASADTPAGWKTTLVETGAGETTVALTEGGRLLITTDAKDNDGANLQLLGEAFKFVASQPLYFGVKFQCSEATQSDFFLGLAITDAENDCLGGVTDGVYFRKVDAATAINLVVEKNTTETAAEVAATFTKDTDWTLEFLWDGTVLRPFVNGVEGTAAVLTNLPDDEYLTVSMQFLSGADGAKTMSVDWVRAIQIAA